MGGVPNAPGPSPTLGSLGPSHQWRHKSQASLRGPPCAHGVAGTPQGEVRDSASGVQIDHDHAQARGHGTGDMEDLVELRVTLPKGSKEPNQSYDDSKSYLGASNEAPLQIGEDLPYYLQNLVSKSDFIQEGAEGEMAILAKVGLLCFATWTSNIPLLDSKLVQTFLEKYNPPERKAEFFKLAFI